MESLRPAVAVLYLGTLIFTLPAQAATLKMPAGTPISLRVLNDVSGESANTGDLINLSVTSDVIVDGKVVIPANSTALGQIIKAKKKGLIGIPGEIAIQVTTVNAPNGSSIPVSVSKSSEGESKIVFSVVLSLICCLLFLLKHGGEAVIKAGTVLNATTVAPIDIEVK